MVVTLANTARDADDGDDEGIDDAEEEEDVSLEAGMTQPRRHCCVGICLGVKTWPPEDVTRIRAEGADKVVW